MTKTFIKTIQIIDYSKVPSGTYFTAKIRNRKVSGTIYNDTENTYMRFCQNTIQDEVSSYSGYKHAYVIDYSDHDIDPTVLDQWNIKELEFPDPPEGYNPGIEIPTINGCIPEIKKGYVDFNGDKVKNEVFREFVKQLKD